MKDNIALEYEKFKKGEQDFYRVSQARRWVEETDYESIQNGWVKKQRLLLRHGNHNEVIETIKSVCKGTRNNLLKRERNYFIKNTSRMNYGEVAEKKMPIGSGAIESTIRRVINLRLKGPCIFLHEDSADEMIMLRSYYKSGRWDLLKTMACNLTMPCV